MTKKLFKIKGTVCKFSPLEVAALSWAHSELRDGSPEGSVGGCYRENRFSFKQVDVNYTFKLIDKIDLSPSPTSNRSFQLKTSPLSITFLSVEKNMLFEAGEKHPQIKCCLKRKQSKAVPNKHVCGVWCERTTGYRLCHWRKTLLWVIDTFWWWWCF